MTDADAPTGGVGVVVVAAGSGTRLGADVPKALVTLGDRTLLEHAVCRALAAADVSAVVVVAPASHLEQVRDVVPDGVQVVAGGAERTDSVAAGLAALAAQIDVVLVHDAARALTPPRVFDEVVAAIRAGADAVVPGLPVADTIKVVDERGRVTDTLPRDTLRAIQTPQGFRRAALEAAHAAGAAATDDAALVERAGGVVQVIPGHPDAMKVTTPADLEIAQRLLSREETR